MSEPSEREEAPERLRQIRGRFGTSPATWEDIGFLLSLLDSQAESIELLRKIPAVANDALNMTLGQIQESAATRMRERCAEKVRALGAGWKSIGDKSHGRDETHYYAKADAADDIITALESLTLDGEKEQ